MTCGQEEAPWRRSGLGGGSSNAWGATAAATWGATWSANWWEAHGDHTNNYSCEKAVLVATIFIFLTGFALGSMTTYFTTKAVTGQIVVAGPPPAEPAAEARIYHQRRRTRKAGFDGSEAEHGHHRHH